LFRKATLAIELHEMDEAVIDRQSPLWLDLLGDMLEARNAPVTTTPKIVTAREAMQMIGK
jgi:hypothetical protein